MGMYTGIRFKGIVKKEFRSEFERIAYGGEWDEHSDEKFIEFSKVDRAGFIPCGMSCYMPDEWEKDYINSKGEKEIDFANYYKQVATDGFNRTYDENTGYWSFQCSLKNYSGTIESFFELLPYFIESIEHLEYFYEEWQYSEKYELINGEVICTNEEFINYGDDNNEK